MKNKLSSLFFHKQLKLLVICAGASQIALMTGKNVKFSSRKRSRMEIIMLNIILTQKNTFIIGWCAKLLGQVMEWIYKLFSNFGIENIALCIVIFTLLVKLVLIPLTIKQQKYAKVSSLMTPEIQAVQKKYQNKRGDQQAMIKMNEETQAIYQKYGTSPTGSCLQMLIQMPILFSLYYIIGSMPAYVQPVYDYYTPVTDAIVADYDYYEFMDDVYDEYVDKDDKNSKDEYKYIDDMLDSFDKITEKKLIDTLSKYSTSQWENLTKSYENVNNMVLDISENVTDEEWDSILSEEDNKKFADFVEAIKDNDISEYIDGSNSEDSTVEVIKSAESKLMKINEFGPINLSQTPGFIGGIAYIIPILCFLTQWLSVQISMKSNKEQMQENPMGNSMKVMNIMLPLMSAFIAISVPSGLGFYWALSGIIQIVTQLCLNAYFKKVDVQDIIDANVAKANKKKEKMGIDVTKVTSTASTSTKGIKTKANVNNTKSNSSSTVKYKQGSMAAKANMVKEFDDKKRK